MGSCVKCSSQGEVLNTADNIPAGSQLIHGREEVGQVRTTVRPHEVACFQRLILPPKLTNMSCNRKPSHYSEHQR